MLGLPKKRKQPQKKSLSKKRKANRVERVEAIINSDGGKIVSTVLSKTKGSYIVRACGVDYPDDCYQNDVVSEANIYPWRPAEAFADYYIGQKLEALHFPKAGGTIWYEAKIDKFCSHNRWQIQFTYGGVVEVMRTDMMRTVAN